MRTQNISQPEILVITPYAHSECPISQYSMNLNSAIKERFNEAYNYRVCAVEPSATERNYPSEVKYVLDSQQKSDYKTLAAKINADDAISAVFIQHDFHLFGGDFGSYILVLMRALKKPVFVTFHAVYSSPEAKRSRIVKRIAKRSELIFCLSEHAIERLTTTYSIPERKLKYIPSGTHALKNKSKIDLKHKYGFEGRTVISTHGLIGPEKNLENALVSISHIVEEYPDVIYLIIGKTHPQIQASSGEQYREILMNKAITLGIQKNVFFINKFLEIPELLEILQMTDIYFHTSTNKDHAVSRTLINAVNGACPIIVSTSLFSSSLVSQEMGILVDTTNHHEVSLAILQVLNNETLCNKMSQRVLQKSIEIEWYNSAIKHCSYIHERLSSERLVYTLPDISLKHLLKLTHHFGVVQSSKMDQPNYSSGYSLDYNTIALVTACIDFEVRRDARSLMLIEKYLRFLGSCQKENGKFFMELDEVGNELKTDNTTDNEESNGRAIWALGTVISYRTILPKALVTRAELYLSFAIPTIAEMTSLRAKAFCIKGLFLFNLKHHNRQVNDLIISLGLVLVEKYGLMKEGDWRWFDRSFSKNDSILPESLLYVYLTSKRGIFKLVAQATFDFLLSQSCVHNFIRVIPIEERNDSTKEKTHFDEERPEDLSLLIQSTQLFHEIFKEKRYLNYMEIAFSWYLGNNRLHQMMYNPLTGGCYDGIHKSAIILDQGPASTINFLLARLSMEKSRRCVPVLQEQSSYKPQYTHYSTQPNMTINL